MSSLNVDAGVCGRRLRKQMGFGWSGDGGGGGSAKRRRRLEKVSPRGCGSVDGCGGPSRCRRDLGGQVVEWRWVVMHYADDRSVEKEQEMQYVMKGEKRERGEEMVEGAPSWGRTEWRGVGGGDS